MKTILLFESAYINYVCLIGFGLVSFTLCQCQHDNGYIIDGRSQIEVHTGEMTQVLNARSSYWSPMQVLTEVDVP